MSGSGDLSLSGGLVTLAYCVSIGRPDGVQIAFTSHDRPIRAGGLSFEPRPGFVPSAIALSASMRPDDMELTGVVDPSWISALDLDAGRWREARVRVSLCDWSASPPAFLLLFEGVIGGVRQPVGSGAKGLVLELLSDMAVAGRERLPVCSPLCRAELGDRWCGVDLTERRREVELIHCDGERLRMVSGLTDPEHYRFGRLRLMTGTLAGVDRRIVSIDGDMILVSEPVASVGEVSWKARLTEGCDKRLATCQGRFSNVEAFLGHPHVPGTDALVRFGDG